jgi:hypothetical protein
MSPAEFQKLLRTRFDECIALSEKKSGEYSRNGDKFSNFITAGRYDSESPERALWGMWKKHIVSIQDIILDVELGRELPSLAVIEEKSRDNIIYTAIFEGMMRDRLAGLELEQSLKNVNV